MTNYNIKARGIVKPDNSKSEYIKQQLSAATECLDNGWTLIPIGLTKNDKGELVEKPTCKWKQPPPPSTIFNHIKNPERTGTNGKLAFIPYSAGLIVLDIDKGGMVSVREVQAALDCEALAVIPSKRRERYHLPYATDEGERLTRKDIYTDLENKNHVGEVISARQYISMHRGILPYLEAWRGSHPVPGLVARVVRKLLNKKAQRQLHGMPSLPRRELGSVEVCTGQIACLSLKINDTTAAIVKAARIGARHITLLTVATFIAKSYANINATLAKLTQTILYLNNQLREPLPIDEVELIAAWVWNEAQHDGTKERYRANQREKQRRMIDKLRTVRGLDDRDIQIHEANKQGLSQRQIAKLFSLSRRTIQKVLAKPCPPQLTLLDRLNRTEN